MNAETAQQYLLKKPEAILDYPFGPEAQVFKVHGKLFAILGNFRGKPRVNLKCDPDEAIALRDIFPSVTPGYHMNKKHWNTVALDGSVPRKEVERMMDRSYGLIVKGLPKNERQALELSYGAEALYR